MLNSPQPFPSKIKKLSLSQLPFNHAPINSPFASGLSSRTSSIPRIKPLNLTPRLLKNVQTPTETLKSQRSTPVLTPKRNLLLSPSLLVNKEAGRHMRTNSNVEKQALFGNQPNSTQYAAKTRVIRLKRKVSRTTETLKDETIDQEAKKKEIQDLLKVKQKRLEILLNGQKTQNGPEEVRLQQDHPQTKEDYLSMFGKILEMEAKQIYSSRSASANWRQNQRKSDATLTSPSPQFDWKKVDDNSYSMRSTNLNWKGLHHMRNGSMSSRNLKEYELSSQTQYSLQDRQKVLGFQGVRRKPAKPTGDKRILDCFKNLKTNFKEDLLQEPHFSFFKTYTTRKAEALRLENIDMIKDICKGAVISKKHLIPN